MEKALFPLNCFGNIQYFATLLRCQHVVLESSEHYVKQSFRNRYYVAGPNGIHLLTVPILRKSGEHTPYTQMEISYTEDWQDLHWKTLEAGYRSSPYFEYYEMDLQPFYHTKTTSLFEYNRMILLKVLELLQMEVGLSYTDTFQKEITNMPDLRERLGAKKYAHIVQFREYIQVFADRFPFHNNLSILDLLFALGPNSRAYLAEIALDEVIVN